MASRARISLILLLSFTTIVPGKFWGSTTSWGWLAAASLAPLPGRRVDRGLRLSPAMFQSNSSKAKGRAVLYNQR